MTMTDYPTAARSVDRFEMIDLSLLYPDPGNVREGELTDIPSLAESILLNGLQQPLRVRLQRSGYFENDPGCAVYVAIAGHRRLAAIKSLGELWQGAVPCMIAPEDTDTDAITAAMLVENLQRADLNCIEEAHAFSRLMSEFGYTKADVAARISRSESYVTDRLNLLKLPETIIESVRVGFYPMTSALLLKSVPHDIVERITKGGRLVVIQYQIDDALATAKWDKLLAAAKAKFAELVAGGLEELGNAQDWWKVAKTSKQHINVSTLTDINKLKVADLPKKAVGRLDLRTYSKQASIEIRVPLTPKQLTALEEKAIAAEIAEEEAERAEWTPEYTEWVAIRDEIRALNVERLEAWEDKLTAAKAAWARAITAKDVARLAMLNVANGAGSYSREWERRKAAVLLGLSDQEHGTADHFNAVITEHCNKGAAELVSFVAAVLLIEKESGALASFETFARKHDIELDAPADDKVPAQPKQYIGDQEDDEHDDDAADDE